MSRTYSNFLLFEDILDLAPTEGGVVKQAVDLLLNPSVKIVEQDCNTLLGKVSDTSYELEGYIDVTDKSLITKATINNWLSQGKYKAGVRNLYTCQSHRLGGVCKMCYDSETMGTQGGITVGSNKKIPALKVYQSDVVLGTGYSRTFQLTQSTDDWYEARVITEGVRQTSGYSFDGSFITFDVAPAQDTVYVIHFLKQNTDPLLGWISKTYSGALLGVQPLPTIDPFIRMSLYESMFPDTFVTLVIDEVRKYKAIPSTYMDYLERVHDRMEKLLLALYLYAIYSQVEV